MAIDFVLFRESDDWTREVADNGRSVTRKQLVELPGSKHLPDG